MSGHNHNEGGAHGPEATPGKVGLREKLTHPHGHKDHPKDESDGGDPVHELPTHAQKDAYSAEAAASSKHAMKRHTVHAGEYVGQSMGGKRHGKGSYTWGCGQKYEGAWREDMRSGIGTETWTDGRKYHGDWREDAFDGAGTFTWADGTVYKGSFARYAPIEGEMFLTTGEVYAVMYDGSDEVWSGLKPSPIMRIALLDQNIVQDKVDKMYEALCTGNLYGDLIKEKVLKGNTTTGGLQIDEVFFEDIEGMDDEVEVTFDVKRLSGEMQRSMMAAATDTDGKSKGKAFGKEKGGFQGGQGMGRVSMDNAASAATRAMFGKREMEAALGRAMLTSDEVTEEIKPMRLKQSTVDPEGYEKRRSSNEARKKSIEGKRRSSADGRRSSGDGGRRASGDMGRKGSAEMERPGRGSIEIPQQYDSSDARIKELTDMLKSDKAAAEATDPGRRTSMEAGAAMQDARIDLSTGVVKIKVKRDQIAGMQKRG